MKDYYEMGTTPSDEPCIQVTKDGDYHEAMKKECRIYKNQLDRMFSEKLLPGMYFTVKSFPHDFGTYYEVCLVYDDCKDEQAEAMIEIENNLPEKWDSEALAELKEENVYAK